MSINRIKEIDPNGSFVKLDLTSDEIVQLIAFYYNMYWNTDQDCSIFGEEYYHLTIGLCKGEIPCRLKYLSGYKDEMIGAFPDLNEVIKQYIRDDAGNIGSRKPIAANRRPIEPGSIVLSSPNDDYELLVGRVFDIALLGSLYKNTDNESDDIYCDFREFDYSEQRVAEIEAMLSALYDMPKTIGESCLDYAIMDPAELIVIDEVPEEILQSRAAAEAFWKKEMGE